MKPNVAVALRDNQKFSLPFLFAATILMSFVCATLRIFPIVIGQKQAVTARGAIYIVRTARNRALPSATRS